MENLYEMAREKAVLRKSQLNSLASTDQMGESGLGMPIISLNSIHTDFESLSQIYQLKERNIETPNLIKKILYKVIKKMIGWYIRPLMEQQSEFNLRTVRILDASVQTIDYIQRSHLYEKLDAIGEVESVKNGISGTAEGSLFKPPTVIFECTDPLMKEFRQDEVLLIYHYYNRFINKYSHLVILSEEAGTGNYLPYLIRIKEELKIRNVHFIINPDDVTKRDFCDMANAFITLKSQANMGKKGVPVFCRLEEEDDSHGNSYFIGDMCVEEAAELMNLVLYKNGVHYENGLC